MKEKFTRALATFSFMEPRQAHDGRKVDQHSGGSSDLVAPELKVAGTILGIRRTTFSFYELRSINDPKVGRP